MSSQATLAEPKPGRSPFVARLAGRPVFWIVWVVLGFSLPLVGALRRPAPPALPTLGTLETFTLQDQDGRPFGSENLKGRVWVANFIFTRCPTVCPRLTERMGTLQHRGRNLQDALHLVSFSVDPAYDTPERLAQYARTHRVNGRRWALLTGEQEQLQKTIVEGLKIAMGSPGDTDDFASVFHGTHFVLVDAQMRIRGYYDSTADDMEDRILRDAAMLINQGG